MERIFDKAFIRTEKKFLNRKSKTYVAGRSLQDNLIRELVYRTFEPYISGKLGLEFGCSDGYMTQLLAKRLDMLEVLEGSKYFIDKAKKRDLKNVKFIHSLFEEFKPVKRYNYVFLCYVLEHVHDVAGLLNIVKESLQPDGLLFVVVPNAHALSRQLAYQMGLIERLEELTQNDLNHGHRRVYDRVSLNRDLESQGFTCIAQGGVMLKFLADFQMDKLLEIGVLKHSQIDGLYKLGMQYPEFCGSLFSICKFVK